MTMRLTRLVLAPCLALLFSSIPAWAQQAMPPDYSTVLSALGKLTEDEVNPVRSAALDNGLAVTALHNMTDVEPMVGFLHDYGTGPAAKLADGVRAAVAELGKGR